MVAHRWPRLCINSRHGSWEVLLVVLLVALSGCSDDGPKQPENSATGTTTETVETVAKGPDPITGEQSTDRGDNGAAVTAVKPAENAQSTDRTDGDPVDVAQRDSGRPSQPTVSGNASAQPVTSDSKKTLTASGEAVPPAPEPKKPAPLSGPHKATVSFFAAMMAGESERAASLVAGTDAQRAAVVALTMFQKAGNEFRRRFVKVYGADAWRAFNDPGHMPEKPGSERPPFNASIPLFQQRDLDQMKLYRPQVSGNEAVYPSAQGGEMRLIREDGNWRVDASTILPTGADDPKPAEEMMRQRAEAISRFVAAIGKKGVSADDIDVELGRAFIEARYGMKIPEPHRFDVSALQ